MGPASVPNPPASASAAVRRLAIEQFTAHGASFGSSPVMNDGAALDALVELCRLASGDRVADVACGPGIVSCRLAAAGATVVGIDATPAVLDLARARATAHGVDAGGGTHLVLLGDMERLPLADGSVDVAVSRYALHHAADPAAVAAELVRVVRPGGRIVVVDFAATTDEAAATAYDEAERWRDPSHVRNLTAAEQERLFAEAGCRLDAATTYRLPADLDTVLARSHGVDHGRVRAAFEASIGGHGLGVDAHHDGARIAFAYPIAGFRFVTAAGATQRPAATGVESSR